MRKTMQHWDTEITGDAKVEMLHPVMDSIQVKPLRTNGEIRLKGGSAEIRGIFNLTILCDKRDC